jgi:hypothetical protein
MDNVVPMRAPASERYSYRDQEEATRKISRDWRPYLSGSEGWFLLFLKDQTISMQRAEWGFSYRSMGHGNHVMGGTGYSRPQLIRLVDALAKRGVITKVPNPKGVLISLNLDWKPGKDTPLASERRKKPKKDRPAKPMPASTLWNKQVGGITSETPRGITNETPPVSPVRPIKEGYRKEENKKVETPSPAASVGMDSGEIKIRRRSRPTGRASALPSYPEEEPSPDCARPPSATAHIKKRRRPTTSLLNPFAIEETFQKAFEEAFADCPGVIYLPLNSRDGLKLKNTLLAEWTGTAEELHALIRWTVLEWDRVRGSVFGFMTRNPPPTTPALSFIAANIMWLKTAYRHRDRQTWTDGFNDYDWRVYKEEMEKPGRTPEEIQTAIGEARARRKLRKERDAAKEKIDARLKRAKAAEERIRQMGGQHLLEDSPVAGSA